jgi:sporulation protein YlmC with PRC-barrel domain
MNIALNAQVNCSDGPCGHLDHIILKSANDEITHLVVRDDNQPQQEYLVPLDLVTDANHDRVQINCTCDELHSMPIFEKDEYIPRSIFKYQLKSYQVTPYAVIPGLHVPVKVEHIPAGELAVKKGANVEATDGQVGFVDEFLIDAEDNHLSHLILRQGHLWGQKDVTIPLEQVERLEEDTVYLKTSKSEVESLPTTPIHRFWVKKNS